MSVRRAARIVGYAVVYFSQAEPLLKRLARFAPIEVKKTQVDFFLENQVRLVRRVYKMTHGIKSDLRRCVSSVPLF
jgi:hypothetical protein